MVIFNSGSLTVGQAIFNILPYGTLGYLPDEDIESEKVDGSPSPTSTNDADDWVEPPIWPTDLFVTVAHVAHASGLLTYFDPDPEFGHDKPHNPVSFAVSSDERRACIAAGQTWAIIPEVPPLVYRLWRRIHKAWDDPVRASSYAQRRGRRKAPAWWSAVVQLIILADEACVGLGAPSNDALPDRWLVDFYQQYYARPYKKANRLTNVGYRGDRLPTTFGFESDPDIACVHPKNRIAAVGCNLRNLTRHVTYVPHAGNVRCHWQQPINSTLTEDAAILDILIIPLPLQMKAEWIKPSATVKPSRDRPNWGNFEIEQGWLENTEALCDFVADEVQKAKLCIPDNNINAVVFPEFALTEPLFNKICERIKAIEPKLEFAISGSSSNCEGETGNFVLTALWYQTKTGGRGSQNRYLLTSRRKHHRWKLTTNQIKDYDLDGVLNPDVSWWETHSIAQREIHFYHFRQTSTFTSMICEDLARSDPCHDILRSVGPNLLFALLMDGPQKQGRWPARYASTLADDPGTSVLTVTSMGLIERTNGLKKYPPSSVIAMWRDESGLTKELSLDEGSSSLVLSLKAETVVDQTLDGRICPNARSWRYQAHKSV